MKLSALEIKQQSFSKSIRGYDVAEVQSFLNVVSNEWEHLANKNRDQQHEIQRLTEKLEHYQKVEEALHETLQQAKESAEQRVYSSKQDAQNRIAKADLEAEKIVREAQQERQDIRRSIQRLLDRRLEIIRGMESYLELASESLESFKRDDSTTYALPEDEQGTDHSESADDQTADSSSATGSGNTGSSSKKGSKQPTPAPGADDFDDLLDDIDE